MNYYIEKHDMNMILDALELLRSTIKTRELFGLPNKYTENDVDDLFQSFDHSFVENKSIF